jgi:hypothetical protein
MTVVNPTKVMRAEVLLTSFNPTQVHNTTPLTTAIFSISQNITYLQYHASDDKKPESAVEYNPQIRLIRVSFVAGLLIIN